MNLGSPDSIKVKDVRKYLAQFLMDGRVIDVPYLLRLLLVRGIIVPFRAPRSAKAYQSIWTSEGSPLINLTKQLREAVEIETAEEVEIAMRYGNPTVEAGFDKLVSRIPELNEVIAVPLYPHYAMSSFETAVEYAKEIHKKKNYSFKLSFLKPFYDESAYITALSESIKPYVQKEYDHIVFSFHGVPERHVRKSDVTKSHCLSSVDCCDVNSEAHAYCYRHQCIETMKQVAATLQIPKEKFSYAFQSRLGRDQWLKPYTAVRLKEMPNEGIKKLLVVCPAFVSDCLETLEEMAIEGKETFLESGGDSFELIPCLNLNPLWVKALAGYIQSIGKGDRDLLLI